MILILFLGGCSKLELYFLFLKILIKNEYKSFPYKWPNGWGEAHFCFSFVFSRIIIKKIKKIQALCGRRVWTFTYSRVGQIQETWLPKLIYLASSGRRRQSSVVTSTYPCSRAKILERRLEEEKGKSESKHKDRGLFANWNGFARSRWVRGLGRSEPGTGRFVAPLRLRRPGIRGFLSFYYIFCFWSYSMN
jgi:hypothetical protein